MVVGQFELNGQLLMGTAGAPILNSKLTHYQNNLPLSDCQFTPL